MASFELDNVKAEKEDALWRYNMEMKLSIALRFIGFLLLFFLLSWPCFPSFQAAGDFRRRFVSTFNKPLFTFIVVNVIIVAVYVLSTPKKSHKQSSTNDIYNEYVSSRRSIPASTVVPTAVSNSSIEVDKQIVNGVAIYQVKHRPAIVDTIAETKTSLSKVKQHATKIRRVAKTEAEASSAENMPKQYRRTRSMVSESRPRDRGVSECEQSRVRHRAAEEINGRDEQ
ncbi:CYP722 protein [Hibiscus syriacus]|uniref:CYP722 protein n=1 Tax=Hibiscus syriacus TaxID=106335 RepID=A0A6A2WUL8_HIBSY|nr:CYP722 protein [Hibiscus syriacus]